MDNSKICNLHFLFLFWELSLKDFVILQIDKYVLMNRKLFAVLVALVLCNQLFAYDFSAVVPSGQTLFFNVVGNGEVVVASGENVNGSLLIPETVVKPSTSMSYTIVGISDAAFRNYYGLISVQIEAPIRSIGQHAFDGCQSLTNVNIPNTVSSIENYAFYECGSWAGVLEIPSSVVAIGMASFCGCSSLSGIILPETITSIPDFAFSHCKSLLTVDLPSSIVSIGNSAFQYCEQLSSITLSESITSIETGAFFGCTSLSSIEIPASVSNIGTIVFVGCSALTSIIVNPSNTVYDSRNDSNAIIETASNTLLFGCQSTIVPENITSIEEDAFNGHSRLTNISIPNCVENIGSAAFKNCVGLLSITLPANLKTIGIMTFYGCSSLQAVTIPDSVVSIGGNAFSSCVNLEHVTIGKSVEIIEGQSFKDCANLQTVNYNADSCLNVGGIHGAPVFENCDRFSNLNIGENVRVIPANIFKQCNGLQVVDIPSTVSILGKESFEGCRNISKLVLGSGLTYIGDKAFKGCISLEDVVYCADSCIYMGNVSLPVFMNCPNLVSLTIASEVKSFPMFAFCGCPSIQQIKSMAYIPPIIQGNSFENLNSNVLLSVPCNAINAYESANYWNLCSIQGSYDHTVSVQSSNDTQGYVTVVTNPDCESHYATIQAFPHEGFTFDRWDDENADNPRTIEIVSDMVFTAYFKSNNDVDEIGSDNIVVYAVNGAILVEGAENKKFELYSIDGCLVKAGALVDSPTRIEMKNTGLFLIKIANSRVYKIVVSRE